MHPLPALMVRNQERLEGSQPGVYERLNSVDKEIIHHHHQNHHIMSSFSKITQMVNYKQARSALN
jgi:hypothetical protein